MTSELLLPASERQVHLHHTTSLQLKASSLLLTLRPRSSRLCLELSPVCLAICRACWYIPILSWTTVTTSPPKLLGEWAGLGEAWGDLAGAGGVVGLRAGGDRWVVGEGAAAGAGAGAGSSSCCSSSASSDCGVQQNHDLRFCNLWTNMTHIMHVEMENVIRSLMKANR